MRQRVTAHQTTCGQLTVGQQQTFDPSLVSVDTCSVQQSTISPGDTIQVSLDYSNGNSSGAIVDFEALANGSPISTDNFFAQPGGGSEVVDIDTSGLPEGQFDIAIDPINVTQG